ncbi:MAG: phenylalanine--tRNA ligase subunit alpha [Ignavibacteriales bacterium]|nr:phenylalanine--tRNA ligase subunit alpha [Ignavibacteriales bacterium]
MQDRIEEIRKQFTAEIEAIQSLDQLEQLRIKFLARKGSIAELFDALKNASPDQKPVMGKLLNELRSLAQAAFDAAKSRLEQAAQPQEAPFDVTLPGRYVPLGTKHPIVQTLDEYKRIFVGMGFSIVTGPEIENDYYNFDALNFAPDHPARDMQDTFFIHGSKILLRTHTTPVQVRIMEQQKPPVRAIMPGKVYRNEAVSARSLVQFHQVDGIYVDKGVTFSELKGTLVTFAKQYYGSSIKYRFRPSYFPFTEPSAEMDITCYLCAGKGCRICKHSGWLEIVGSGMVHPNILKRVGYDPEKISGFAFGFGVERSLLLRAGIDDIRILYENDLRFLRQF